MAVNVYKCYIFEHQMKDHMPFLILVCKRLSISSYFIHLSQISFFYDQSVPLYENESATIAIYLPDLHLQNILHIRALLSGTAQTEVEEGKQ